MGPKGEEMLLNWRKLHDDELRNFLPSLDIIGMIKPSVIRWAERVACMGRIRIYTV